MQDMPQIHIHNLEVRGRVGVTDEERDQPQRLVANVTVWPRVHFDASGDDIARTVNYAAVALEVQSVITAATDRLIETLTERVLQRLVHTFPITKAEVEIRKFVVPDTEYVSVRAVRHAATQDA